MRIAALEGKRVALFGLGREGWAMYRVLRARLPQQALTILDDSPLAEADLVQLAADSAVDCVTGEAARHSLGDFDVVIKSPGISPYTPEFKAARADGTVLTSPTRLWFAEHPHARTVCITGTKGKSTTSSLLAHLLRYAGVETVLAGNIGIPLWECEDTHSQPQTALFIIELSSYQTSDLDARPGLCVLLNLFPEHTDWHGSHEIYYRDKLNLLIQTGTHPKIVNRADPRSLARLPELPNYRCFNDPQGFHVRGGEIREGDRRVLAAGKSPLPGAHNLSNLCAVLAVLRELDVDLERCLDGLTSFHGLPHRLHLLAERNGVRYVDDSISTTPQSVVAALAAFPGETVTLLVGGYERGLDWSELAIWLAANPLHRLIAMGANGRRIMASVTAALDDAAPPMHYAPHLQEAVELAARLTPKGGMVLLSPGSPSYGEFVNFTARGKAFAIAAGLPGG